MKLTRASAPWLAATMAPLCLALGLCAQSKPASRTAPKPKAATVGDTAAAPPGIQPDREAAKRDPFLPLITEKKDTGNVEHLPPGRAGLQIATVEVEGAVRSADGMIAVVANPERHVYFIREGDRLYDGDVEKIGMDGVTFRQSSKDAFGRPVDRAVTKRIYASAGEQQ